MSWGFFIASVGSCAQTVLGPDKIDDEMQYQINQAMKRLYREGYRRMRATPLPRTGDEVRYVVQGWKA